MKENKNHLRKMAAEKKYAETTVDHSSRPAVTTKKRFESDSVVSSFSLDQDHKHTRRYSFDDNGGGYLGL